MITAVILGAIVMANGTQQMSGKPQANTEADKKPVKIPFDPKKWKLEWADEFNAGKAPNEKFWSYEVGYLRNDELQYYTKARQENCRIEKGRLVIEARKDNFEGHKITAASIHTSKKRPFLYGRIEVRAQLPTGKGTWPAIWLLGENIGQVGWPDCGEIDIMENVGFDPTKVHANIHTGAYNWVKNTAKGNSIDGGKPWEGFHAYAVEWYPDRLEFFYDDTRYMVFRKERADDSVWPFDKPHYLILNFAFGGGWGGSQGVDESLLPLKYAIDYVRYYSSKT